jgi:hypothetical protein
MHLFRPLPDRSSESGHPVCAVKSDVRILQFGLPGSDLLPPLPGYCGAKFKNFALSQEHAASEAKEIGCEWLQRVALRRSPAGSPPSESASPKQELRDC